MNLRYSLPKTYAFRIIAGMALYLWMSDFSGLYLPVAPQLRDHSPTGVEAQEAGLLTFIASALWALFMSTVLTTITWLCNNLFSGKYKPTLVAATVTWTNFTLLLSVGAGTVEQDWLQLAVTLILSWGITVFLAAIAGWFIRSLADPLDPE